MHISDLRITLDEYDPHRAFRRVIRNLEYIDSYSYKLSLFTLECDKRYYGEPTEFTFVIQCETDNEEIIKECERAHHWT